ncbi:bifunctional sulfate adenylyltransferase subunit 1/adenylylsulfate kinase protein [Paramagnetospirillum caucaseum]|uniref:Multifunctional fusion protein n=1 Tax=Paramagnetospirillum caucaseum TaxID=1244869 RepID=M2Z875_9PROT|nr:adenylyl-sulfate kinase [Paramagnetospirillum caucaseum]EME70510.1 bifunctional sulfate adenylyltransferase subunit 1/adenylylsulfate kinase protein [Paramagnetospirillum caucaseum]
MIDLTQMDARAFSDHLDHIQDRALLRFLTCGSVDDGKSTLIGRILHDSGSLTDDQLATLERDSRRTMPGGGLDFSLLVDGLQAEREQGITIDVAYRYFGTERRNFIVADTPGHEQYTRNMVTGASTAELAVLLVDARKGVLAQTRRHAYLVALTGIREVVLAVNKMDLVGYSQVVFDAIAAEFAGFAASVGLERITAIPVSAVTGANLLAPVVETPWYRGPALLPFLETAEPPRPEARRPLRLPVQTVIRPDQNFRGYAGTIAAGRIRIGQEISVEPAGRTSKVTGVFCGARALDEASAGQAVTVTLADDVDISRGDVLAAVDDRPASSDQFSAHVVWMAEQPMLPGRSYLLRLGTRTANCRITHIKHVVNVNTLEKLAATRLGLNDVSVCTLALDQRVPFEPYGRGHGLGGFILIDKVTNATVACGMIDFALRRAQNIHWQALTVDKPAHATLKGHKACLLWFTGLSGSGKSTIADLVEKQLHAMGHHTYLLDGDNLRHGLNRDLGFTDEDRVENIRRVGEVGSLFVDAGLIVLAAFISPFKADRAMVREMLDPGEMVEIFVDAPLAVCEQRDSKGLYRKARAGQLQHFTGVDSPYEPPESPELRLDAQASSPMALADSVVTLLRMKGIIAG